MWCVAGVTEGLGLFRGFVGLLYSAGSFGVPVDSI
jgi:hypothetical protein